jgi:hypothetical protein
MQDVGEHDQQGAGSNGGTGKQMGEKPLKKKKGRPGGPLFLQNLRFRTSLEASSFTDLCFVTCGSNITGHRGLPL